MVFENASGVDIAFDDGRSQVFIGHDDKEFLGVPEIIEDLSLESQEVRRDAAFAEARLQRCEEVLRSVEEGVWD